MKGKGSTKEKHAYQRNMLIRETTNSFCSEYFISAIVNTVYNFDSLI